MYVTPNALSNATKTNTHWLIAMAARIPIEDQPFQVWKFVRDITPEQSALVVEDGNGNELRTFVRDTRDFTFTANGMLPTSTEYWIEYSTDEHGNHVRTLLMPEDH